jgi:hypothetical protein
VREVLQLARPRAVDELVHRVLRCRTSSPPLRSASLPVDRVFCAHVHGTPSQMNVSLTSLQLVPAPNWLAL